MRYDYPTDPTLTEQVAKGTRYFLREAKEGVRLGWQSLTTANYGFGKKKPAERPDPAEVDEGINRLRNAGYIRPEEVIVKQVKTVDEKTGAEVVKEVVEHIPLIPEATGLKAVSPVKAAEKAGLGGKTKLAIVGGAIAAASLVTGWVASQSGRDNSPDKAR